LQGRPNIEPKTEEDKIAYYMADNIRRYALIDIDEIWGIEEGLYCEELYAGRTDLIAVYRGKSAIIDYKSSRLWKRPEWIENYKMQIAAYNLCHKTMFGEGMETGVILIALRPGSKSNQLVQKFVLDKNQLDEYEDKWLETVQKYYDIHSSTN
jgi:genome maintenance exonuclease 1